MNLKNENSQDGNFIFKHSFDGIINGLKDLIRLKLKPDTLYFDPFNLLAKVRRSLPKLNSTRGR